MRLLWAYFWTSEVPKGFLGLPRTGVNYILGKKHTFLGLIVSPWCCKKRNKIQDLVKWAWYTGCLDIDFCSSYPLLYLITWNSVFSICYNEEMKDNIENQSNQRRYHVQDTLYIKVSKKKSQFIRSWICPDHHLDSLLNLKLCVSYLKVICAHPWVSKKDFGDLRSPD